MLIIFLMPIVGRWNLGHRFNVGLSFSLLAGVAFLTFLAMTQDRRDPAFKIAVEEARRDAERVKVLAQSPTGIPREGAVTLLRNDPLTQGPKLFAKNCASCHRYGDNDGTGNELKDAPAASDLKGFASREWLAGLLDPARVDSPHYFGGTKFKEGKMVKFVKKDVAGFSDEQKAQLQKVVTALSAEAALGSQHELDQRDAALVAEGKTLITTEGMRCTECHQFHKPDEDTTAPDLTAFGSRDWLIAFISNPAHARFYGKRNDRMPAFGADKVLDGHAIELIADWLRGEWYEPGR